MRVEQKLAQKCMDVEVICWVYKALVAYFYILRSLWIIMKWVIKDNFVG